jgi:hypothetical protein
MISTLTVSGSLIVSGGLTVNQLARKGNLVVHLDASPSTYTAYDFNSGSFSVTNDSSSILTWPGRWNDLSGNNNHAFPIKAVVAGGTPQQITSFSSSAFPLSSSYLNNSVFINTFSAIANPNQNNAFRLNPIQETTGPLSVFLWVRPKAITQAQNWYINKRPNTGTTQAQWQLIGSSGKFVSAIFYTGSYLDANSLSILSTTTFTINTWWNVGFTLTRNNTGDVLSLYINGKLENSAILTNSITYTSNQIIIGRNNWTSTANMMNADLSQVLIYNVCLTPQEVQNNYQITKYKHQT